MEQHQKLQRIFIFVIFGFVCLLMIFYVVERQELTNPYMIKIRHAINSENNLLSVLDNEIDNV